MSAQKKRHLCLFSPKHHTDWGGPDSMDFVNRETVSAEVRLQRPDAASGLALREPE